MRAKVTPLPDSARTAGAAHAATGMLVGSLWFAVITWFMMLRGVATPPGRPDQTDHALIIASAVICGLTAVISRSRAAIWFIVITTLLGSWCAWLDNTRLGLAIAYEGYAPQLRWWAMVTGWVVFVGRGTASAIWWWSDKLAMDRAAHSGFCPGCGYDLGATPDRCPECGHISRPLAAAADARSSP